MPFIFPYLLRPSHRYRYCCSFIDGTLWNRGKEKECTVCYFSSMMGFSGNAVDTGG